MPTIEEILADLRAGADIDAIASKFTDNLNKAREMYEKESAEATAEAEKVSALTDLLMKAQDFLYTYFPQYFTDDDVLTREDWEEIAKDSIDQMSNVLKALEFLYPSTAKKKKEDEKKPPRGFRAKMHINDDAADTIIKNFLRDFSL